MIKKYSKIHRLHKQHYATVQKKKKKKKKCAMRGAGLIENVLYYFKNSFDDEIYKCILYKGIFETTFYQFVPNATFL